MGKNKKIYCSSILLLLFILPLMSTGTNSESNFQNSLNNNTNVEVETIQEDDFLKEESKNPISADNTVLSWWNETFEYRIEVTITEPGIVDRNEPVNVFLTFEENTHRQNSTRVVKYDGGSIWTEVPSQIWNISKSGIYLTSATITFKATVFVDSSSQYYVYYSSQNVENKTAAYIAESSLQSDVIIDVDIKSVRIQNGIFETSFNRSLGYSSLSKNGINYHTNKSMLPGPGSSVNEGLVGYWDFNEGTGTIAYDKSGNGYNGNLVNNPSWTTGISGNALRFDGTNARAVNMGNPSGLQITGSQTYSLWVYPTDFTTRRNPLVKAYGGEGTITQETNQVLSYYYGTAGRDAQPYQGFSSGIGLKKDEWNHIVLVRDLNAMQLRWYINGVLRNYQTANYNNAVAGTQIFQIGTGYAGNYNGTIDEVRVYNRAITAEEVSILYNEASDSVISKIEMLQDGPVFKTFQIDWTKSKDLSTTDTVTIYEGMDSYKIERSFYWDSKRTIINNSWQVFNTRYDSTVFYQPSTYGQFHSDNNGILQINSTNTITTAQNYSLIRAPINSEGIWTSVGVFITDYQVNPNKINFSQLSWKCWLVNNQFQFSPGNQSDLYHLEPPLATDRLNLTMWEMLQVNDGFKSQASASSEFNSTFYRLKNQLTISNGSVEVLFFNLGFSLTDVDGLPAANINVTLYNTTENWGSRDQKIGSIKSDSTGIVNYTQLKEMNITYIIEYQNPYRTDLQIIELYTSNVTLNTTQSISIENLNLTSVTFTATKLDTPDNILGANISLYWTPLNGITEYIGYGTTDLLGSLKFYYLNQTESAGNYSIKFHFYGDFKKIRFNETNSQLRDELNFTMINSSMLYINAQLGTFSSNFTVTPGSLFRTHTWGENITVTCSYNYTYDGAEEEIEDADVTYELSDGNMVLNSGELIDQGLGIYNFTFNTTDSDFKLMSEFPYLLTLQASKAGYDIQTNTISIQIKEINTTLIKNNSIVTGYWLENFSLEVYFNDTINNRSITDADLVYSCTEKLNLNGVLSPITGFPGWYNLTLNTTSFDSTGTYHIDILANKENHESDTTKIEIIIDAIPTKVSLLQQYISIFWGENFTLGLNFTDDYFKIPITDGSVIFSVVPLIDGLETELIHQLDTPGYYMLKFNSTQFPSAGNYTFQITASKAQYSSKNPTITLQIKTVPTQLTNMTSKNIDVYWKDNITIDVNLNDIRDSLDLVGISDAEVQYKVGQLPGVEGLLLNHPTIAGRYIIVLNSTDFVVSGSYTLRVDATKNQYDSKSMDFFITINRIRTVINDTNFLSTSNTINVTTTHSFFISYETVSGEPIVGASIAYFEWSRIDNPKMIYNGTLNEMGNGIYKLDFETNLKQIGTYLIAIQIGLTNYVERTAAITLIIVEKPIVIIKDPEINTPTISIIQGNNLTFRIQLLDPVNNSLPLTDAKVTITLDGGEPISMTEEGDGYYSYQFTTSSYNALAVAIPVSGEIRIIKGNYTVSPLILQISVTPPEWFGIPRIFIIIGMAVGGIAALIYGTSSYIRYARIPLYVKQIDSFKKTISKKKAASTSKYTLTYNDEIIEKYGSRWDYLDLKLGEILKPNQDSEKYISPSDDIGGEI